MEQVIFDCDNTMGLRTKEIDDGLAYYYLLGRPGIKLMGITTTFGNGTIDQVYTQTKQLVSEVGNPDLPVKRGAGPVNSRFWLPVHWATCGVPRNLTLVFSTISNK